MESHETEQIDQTGVLFDGEVEEENETREFKQKVLFKSICLELRKEMVKMSPSKAFRDFKGKSKEHENPKELNGEIKILLNQQPPLWR